MGTCVPKSQLSPSRRVIAHGQLLMHFLCDCDRNNATLNRQRMNIRAQNRFSMTSCESPFLYVFSMSCIPFPREYKLSFAGDCENLSSPLNQLLITQYYCIFPNDLPLHLVGMIVTMSQKKKKQGQSLKCPRVNTANHFLQYH